MTPEQEAEQAWYNESKVRSFNEFAYMLGISDFKSSLKRRIEERIEQLIGDNLIDKTIKVRLLKENKRFLELLDEVEHENRTD